MVCAEFKENRFKIAAAIVLKTHLYEFYRIVILGSGDLKIKFLKWTRE